jgi:hypothetical protein
VNGYPCGTTVYGFQDKCAQMDRHSFWVGLGSYFDLDGTAGGHVPCGVTAHGSPGGPLQFERLEAALAARFDPSSAPTSFSPYAQTCRIAFLVGTAQTLPASSTKSVQIHT